MGQQNRTDSLAARVHVTLNRLCKWRSVFAGWQLGTRAADDPECQAVRDHREVTMLMRIELNALTALLISKGLITVDEHHTFLIREAEMYDKGLQARFPGASAHDDGMRFTAAAAQWMSKWKP